MKTKEESEGFFHVQLKSLLYDTFDDIMYLKFEEECTFLYFANGKIIRSGYDLRTFQKLFYKVSFFLRTHNSYIVNINHIKSIDQNCEFLYMNDNQLIPVDINLKEILVSETLSNKLGVPQNSILNETLIIRDNFNIAI